MRYLRVRREKVERAWVSDKPTSAQKGTAFDVLGQNVILVRHPYDRHPQSGAGNCWCGRDQTSTIHHIVLEDA